MKKEKGQIPHMLADIKEMADNLEANAQLWKQKKAPKKSILKLIELKTEEHDSSRTLTEEEDAEVNN